MRWINTLERRLGHLAVPGMMRIIVAFNALVFLLGTVEPRLYEWLQLQPDLVLHQYQWWRVVSYIFIPKFSSWFLPPVLAAFLYLQFLWLAGDGLEHAWGSFKLNLYYLVGLAGTTVAVLCFNLSDASGVFLNLSLMYAFATLFPNFPIMLFFIIPVRVKWIALASLAVVALNLVAGENSDRIAIVVALANYLLFFGSTWFAYWREQGRTISRRQEFQMAQVEEIEETLHHCKVCGRTEVSSPDLEFRVASDGEEYCSAHLPSRKAEVAAAITDLPPPLPHEVERD